MENPKQLALVLALLLAASLFLRLWGLGSVGLSEDESNKILAVENYRHGNFGDNAEHPMLMKLLCGASLITAERWNAAFHTSIAPETALRFPVAVIGGLTTPAIYALGVELLNPPAALIAASLWAVDINAIALTRIAKEDPLVTLFFVLGSMFLLRARRVFFETGTQPARLYVLCAACFGLLFASKYLIPIVWLPLLYYDLFRFRGEPRWRISRANWLRIYVAFFATLLILNPILVSPHTWQYAWDHFNHRRVTHQGYFMMDRIMLNKAYYTFWGMTPYFYLIYLYVKTPLLLLIFLAIGLVYTLRRFRDDGFLFLGMYFVLWFFLLSLPGGKFTRYVITWLPAVILLQSLGMYMVYTAVRVHFEKRESGRWIPKALIVALFAATAGWYLLLDFQYQPYHSLYVAAQGGGREKRGYYFPQDDFYDAGLRESIAQICLTAPQNSPVMGTTPAAFKYYQSRFGRPDLRFYLTAEKKLPLDPDLKSYVLYQPYRVYLENYYLLVFFRSSLRPLYTAEVQGLTSVTVYRICRDSSCARIPFWKGKHWPEMLSALTHLTQQHENSKLIYAFQSNWRAGER